MAELFIPYEGKKPFIFTSYAHKDSEKVLEFITVLKEKNYLLWYDEGIPAGSNWPKNIADHMDLASMVIFFRSQYSLASENCMNEIREAGRQGKKIVQLCLDGSTPDDRWQKLFADCPVWEYGGEPEKTIAALEDAKLLDPKLIGRPSDYQTRGSAKNRAGVWTVAAVAGVVLLLASAFGIYSYMNGSLDRFLPEEYMFAAPAPVIVTPQPTPEPTPVPTIDAGAWEGIFESKLTLDGGTGERVIRRLTGISDGSVSIADCTDITDVLVCGNLPVSDLTWISRSLDGTWRVNGAPVLAGDISDLTMFSQIPTIRTLALVDQQIDSIARLSALEYLVTLDLRENAVADLSPLAGMKYLSSLNIAFTHVTDLSPLKDCPSLKTVTVSRDMLPLDLSGLSCEVVVVR